MRLPADDDAARTLMLGAAIDAERAGVKRPIDDLMPVYRDYIDDVECDKLVNRMDESGIDTTAIFAIDNIDWGFDDARIMRINEKCADAASKHPGRTIALACIDPRRSNAPALFRRCIQEFGMRGLKWHPDQGYYPNSEEACAVLKVAEEMGVPLLTHCGQLAYSRSKYAEPIHLDDIAFEFPNLNIIAAHAGYIWWREWAAVALCKENVYGDLAMWQLFAVAKPHLFRRYLREILDIVGHEQVIFSSDGPVFEPHVSNKDWVDIIKSLSNESPDGIKFTDEEVEAILGGNAARIFKL